MPIWPSREKIQKHMPECFKQIYPGCRGIIDASEIKTEAPSSLVLNSEFYSSYKSHTTYKGNIVISPSGEVIHVSVLFAGSISDKELVKRSGLLDLLEPGDQILADKGFTIQDLLAPIGCELSIPAFLSSKGQFTKKDLAKRKQIHNLRVHVERTIRRVKEFHFFVKIVPLSKAGSINQLWTVACLITNFYGPLFYEKSWARKCNLSCSLFYLGCKNCFLKMLHLTSGLSYPVDSSAVFLIYLSTMTCTFHSVYFMTNIKLFECFWIL